MDKQTVFDTLKDKRSFQHMPESMLKKLIEVMQVSQYKQGSILLKQGETNDTVNILLKGQVGIFIGKTFLYNLSRTGDVFGEISFVQGTVGSATVIAMQDSHVVKVSHELLKQLGDTEFYQWLCRVLAEKVTRTSQTISQPQQTRANVLNRVPDAIAKQIEDKLAQLGPTPTILNSSRPLPSARERVRGESMQTLQAGKKKVKAKSAAAADDMNDMRASLYGSNEEAVLPTENAESTDGLTTENASPAKPSSFPADPL